MKKITIALALLILLSVSVLAVVTVSGTEPKEAQRADSVQLLIYGDNAFICINCPAVDASPDADFRQATLAASFPRITCKNNAEKPCVIYTGLKYQGAYNAEDFSPESQPYAIAAEGNYEPGKPLSKGNLNFAPEDGQVAVYIDPVSMEKTLFRIEDPHKLMLVNAKLVIDNSPRGLSESLPEVERESAVESGEQGRILTIQGLAKNAPNQMIDSLAIPLKLGDKLTFTGIEANKDYSLERPVLSIGLIPGAVDADDWLDELPNTFKDAGKDRSKLKLCGKEFVNYYAGSAFEIKKEDDECTIPQYLLNTELFEEDDVDDIKQFPYVCGDIVFEAVGGNARNLYCSQEDIHNALLSCGTDGKDPVCTGADGKTKIKIRIEPGAFEIDNRQQTDTFQSIKEVTSGEQKAYHFLTKRLKLLTHPQSRTPLRYDAVSVTPAEEKQFVVTYKDSTAMGVNTITLPEWSSVFRLRGRQRFAYHLREADYKAVLGEGLHQMLGEGLHQINLIYPEGLAKNEETSTKIREARMRGATRDDIALLGAVAEETIEISDPNAHDYVVTPLRPGQQESAVEAQTSTPSAAAAQATTLGEYAYRHCFRQEAPEFRGAAREATESVARAMLETNPGIRPDPEDILNTPIPAGTVLNLPGTTTEYRLNPRQEQAAALKRAGQRVTSIVRVRINTQGCFGLSSPAITGEQCMDKPGAVVKCAPESRQSQCTTVYQEGEGVKACQENNVCCEVDLSEAGEYCVLPEQGGFLSGGAKCKARCRNAVSNADYGKIDLERVKHCAEGLSCCKTERGSSRAARESAASSAAPRDDSACTSTGGVCIDMVTQECIDREGTPLDFEKNNECFLKGPLWRCCHGTPVGEARQAEETCTSAGGECRVRCGVGERAGTEAQSRECEGKTAIVGMASVPTETCCIPAQAESSVSAPARRRVGDECRAAGGECKEAGLCAPALRTMDNYNVACLSGEVCCKPEPVSTRTSNVGDECRAAGGECKEAGFCAPALRTMDNYNVACLSGEVCCAVVPSR